MLMKTIEAHPLLSQLITIDGLSATGSALGLHQKHLIAKSQPGHIAIDSNKLKIVFDNHCTANHVESVKLCLNFDYQQLLNLPKTDPFHLGENPFADTSFLLKKIKEANYFDKKAISLLIQAHIESWLLTQLHSEASLFSESVSEAVSALSVYQPALAAARLQATFQPTFTLTREIYHNENYSTLLDSLKEIATAPDYFCFASTTLLSLAASEVKLGIYHGDYQAIHRLCDLFTNACARTQLCLEKRRIVLENLLLQATKAQDYYQLHSLMKVLGVAANTFESGEYDYTKDPYYERYIHAAIEMLMRYVGLNDEEGLHTSAEKECHSLLDATITEPDIAGASDVPLLIFRYFLKYERLWDIDPFYHLQDLEEFISSYKNDQNAADIVKPLELRLQQLISLVAQREFVSEDFILYLTSKSPEKMCEIGIDYQPDTKLSLHARQSLAERLIFSGQTNLHDIERGWPKVTYIIANFGMILSDTPHSTTSHHQRLFRTISIQVPSYTVKGRVNQWQGHAEEALYEHLLQEENIKDLLKQFKLQFGIHAKNHKVYGVILDLHGTYDMCLSCSKKGLDFQNTFREKFLRLLPQHALTTRKKFQHQLPIVIRYSSDFQYHFPNDDNDKKKGTLETLLKEGTKRDLTIDQEEKASQEKAYTKRDIRNYGANLLIHGKSNWHAFWSKPKQHEFSSKPLTLESWTAFTTDSQINRMSEEDKRVNYTRLGSVNTTPELDLAMNKLSINK